MIHTAKTPAEIQTCFSVMVQLRPHLSEQEFIDRVNLQMESGYRLTYLKDNDLVVAVAGYRISHCLAWGRFLYVDDLITDETKRSKGYGKQLLDWLREHARQQGCAQLHLDSGIQRLDAHRFYEREGMTNMSHHYSLVL